jgi:hypothetical protein
MLIDCGLHARRSPQEHDSKSSDATGCRERQQALEKAAKPDTLECAGSEDQQDHENGLDASRPSQRRQAWRLSHGRRGRSRLPRAVAGRSCSTTCPALRRYSRSGLRAYSLDQLLGRPPCSSAVRTSPSPRIESASKITPAVAIHPAERNAGLRPPRSAPESRPSQYRPWRRLLRRLSVPKPTVAA